MRLRPELFALSALSIVLLAAGCFPELPLGTPGARDFQRIAAIPVAGAVFDPAALNTRFRHHGFSIDTKVGPRKSFSRGFDSATRRWHASWEMRLDAEVFVDHLGTVYDVSSQPPGAAIPGSHWVLVDAATVKTKGGLTFAFDASGRLAAEHWSLGPYPRLAYAWSGDELVIDECTSLAQEQAGACRRIARVVPGPHGPVEVVDEVSAAGGTQRSATYAYDSEGRLVEAKTPRQHAQGLPGTRYEYDPANRLAVQLLPDGERHEYVWAQTHLIEVRRIGGGAPTERFEYAREAHGGWSVVHTNAVGGRTRYEVSAAREPLRVERLDLPQPELATIDWHAGLRRPTRIVSFAGEVTEFPSWVDDDPAEIVLPSGNSQHYVWAPDAVNLDRPLERAVASIVDDLGAVVAITYDASTGLPEGRSNGEGETISFTFQGANLVSQVAPWGDVADFTSFGAAGHWRKASSSAVPEVTVQRRFDKVGNPLIPAAGLQRGGAPESAFDRDRRLASLEVAATDEEGLVTTTGLVSFELRADGRPLAVRRPLGADHELAYDALGRLVVVCERVEGACNDTQLEYDAVGRRTALTRANGMREEIDYDPYGRVIAHRALRDGVLEGEQTFVWQHDRIVLASDSVRGETRTLAWDAAGRLASESHSSHGEVRLLAYDARSRVVRESLVAPPATGGGSPATLVLGFDHDLADRRIRWFVDDGSPGGLLLRERVISQGRVVEVRDGNGNVRESLFDPQTNRLAGFEMRDAASALLEVTVIERSVELGPTRFQVRSETATALAVTEEEYWLNRPGSLAEPDGKVGMRVFRARGWDDGVLVHDRHFAWDELSNPTDDASGAAFGYNADRTRLLAASGDGWSHAYAYDAAGYVTSRDGLEIAWTATGRVARVGPAAAPLAQAVWDLDGRLVSVETDGEQREFSWFGGRVEHDPAAGGPGWLHLDGVSLPFAGPERRYRHLDFRGNTSLVCDETGAVVSHRRHHAFGLDRVHGSSGSGGSGLLEQVVLSGFAGGVAAQGLALGFTGARVLDYDTGRFLSPDPILHPLNQVTYAVGNPILFEDRGGLHEVTATDVTIAKAGVGVATGFVVSSVIGFVTAVAAFNAAPAALLGIAFVAVVGTGIAAATSLAGLGVAIAILVATQAALDEQKARGGQSKQLELEADLTGAALLSGSNAVMALLAPRFRVDPPTVPPTDGQAAPACASASAVGGFWATGPTWLRAVALGILLALVSAVRTSKNPGGGPCLNRST